MPYHRINRNASTDTESILIAPRDVQKLELMHYFLFLFLAKLIQFNDLDIGGGCSGGGGALGGVRAVRTVDPVECSPFEYSWLQ